MPLIDASASVLVVIDAQPGFAEGLGPSDAEAARRALDHLAWLAGLAVALDVPVVVTEEDAGRNGGTDPQVLGRLGDRAVPLDKPTFGLTGTPEILAAVVGTGRRVAVLGGFETDVCVAQSALGLLGAGLEVVVVDDATSSPGQMHEHGLRRAVAAGATRVHTKGLAYEWWRTLERSRAVLREHPHLATSVPFRL